MTLEYIYGKKQYLADAHDRVRDGYADARAQYYSQCFVYWLIYAFGVWLAYEVENLFGVGVFVWLLIYTMYQQIPYKKAFEEALNTQAAGIEDRHITLTVSDEGLTETELGIVSFCPWASVTRYRYFDRILVIELKTGQSAVIDQSTLKTPNQDLQAVIAQLDAYEVPSEVR